MEEILEKIDEIVKDLDYHGISSNYNIYLGLNYQDLIDIAKFIKTNANINKKAAIINNLFKLFFFKFKPPFHLFEIILYILLPKVI